VEDARPADGLRIDVFGVLERFGLAAFPELCGDVIFVLLGDGRKGLSTGSGDVSAADDKAADCIIALMVGRDCIGFGGDIRATAALVGETTSRSSSEETRSTTAASFDSGLVCPLIPRGVVEDTCFAGLCFEGIGEDERDISLPVSSLGRLASCS
jgi:hypothetical protein